MIEQTMDQKIMAAIDGAHDAGMSLSAADHAREIDARLDAVAVAFMAKRPDLAPMSLDEWLLQHMDSLSEPERADAQAIINAYQSGE